MAANAKEIALDRNRQIHQTLQDFLRDNIDTDAGIDIANNLVKQGNCEPLLRALANMPSEDFSHDVIEGELALRLGQMLTRLAAFIETHSINGSVTIVGLQQTMMTEDFTGLAGAHLMITAGESAERQDLLVTFTADEVLVEYMPKAAVADQATTAGMATVEQQQMLIDISQIKRILVAEDSVAGMIVKGLVSRLGYEVVWAKNGSLAVTGYQSQSFDVVIMDRQMPEMDGVEAIKQIRAFEQQHSCVPSIILGFTSAAEGFPEEVTSMIDANLEKPFKTANFQAKLNEVLAKRNRENLGETDGASAKAEGSGTDRSGSDEHQQGGQAPTGGGANDGSASNSSSSSSSGTSIISSSEGGRGDGEAVSVGGNPHVLFSPRPTTARGRRRHRKVGVAAEPVQGAAENNDQLPDNAEPGQGEVGNNGQPAADAAPAQDAAGNDGQLPAGAAPQPGGAGAGNNAQQADAQDHGSKSCCAMM